ncbi:hypothetical protein PENARI_c018G01898 [Penicillium arizonense]|uniref:Uncharacterized protein n=1 Tax=Penicillium arizonense TaxID=1835702 RepID=A0A1F5L9X5_PENAI|nr:hypothetical protein PENARI_c018G01898 [Penicillium arizonense]
MAREDPVSETR